MPSSADIRGWGDLVVGLTELLEGVAQAWPVPVTRLAVLNHAIGGVVTRAACAVAGERG